MSTIKIMKKLVLATSAAVSPFLTASTALAQQISITPPSIGFKTLGNFVTNVMTLAFAFGILVVLVMLIWGAFEWITSGGDKEHVASARGRIINALIGLAVLAITFALARVAAQFLGFDIGNIQIPTPNTSPAPSGQF